MTGLPINKQLRRLRAPFSAQLGAIALAWASQAGAQSLDQSYTQGFDLNPIDPTPAGDRFMLVPGGFSDPDAPKGAGPVRGKLFTYYSLAPSLTRTDDDTGETADIVQHQLYLHANATAYLLPWLLVNADMPFALMQTGQGAAAPGAAVGDLKLNARFGLLDKRSGAFGLSPGISLWLPTGSPTNLTGDENMRAEPYISIGGQAGLFVYSAKAGVQFRSSLYTGSLKVGNSMTYGAAMGLSFLDNRLQVGPELAGRSLLANNPAEPVSSSSSPVTGLMGAKVQLGPMNLGGAVSIGLTDAPGTAPRVMFSLAYAPIKKVPQRPKKRDKALAPAEEELNLAAAPLEEDSLPPESDIDAPAATTSLDSDGDGIADDVDSCPGIPGEDSPSTELHGCPPTATHEASPEPPPRPVAPPVILSPNQDTDQDGILDTADSCPYDKGVAQPDNEARNGCPHVAPDAPSAAALAPAAARKPAVMQPVAKGPPTATWVGFRETGPKSALIYVNLSETVEVSETAKDKTLTFTMKGTRVQIRNNRNPLLAQHFGSVVKSARLVPKGRDLQLVIQLKTTATPQARVVREAHGAVLRIELSAEK